MVDIFGTPVDGSVDSIEGSLLSRSLLLNGWKPCHYGRLSVIEIFVTPMDGSLVIMEGSLLSISLLLEWMICLSLLKVVCCRYFC